MNGHKHARPTPRPSPFCPVLSSDRTGFACRRCSGGWPQGSDGAGWAFVHVAIDDARLIAFGSLPLDGRGISACQALRYYRGLGVRVTCIMTEMAASTAPGVPVAWSTDWVCGICGWTRPCTPRTNGKAERFI